MYNEKAVIEIIKLTTGKEVTLEEIEFARNKYPVPTNLDELLEDPFRKQYTWLIGNRPVAIDRIVDWHLDCGYRHSDLTLDEILDIFSDMREEGVTERQDEEIKEAIDWLVQHRYGSMNLDW